MDASAFGIPSDLNVQFDRPEFDRNINFLLGRVGRITRGFAWNGQRYVDDLLRVKAQYNEMEFYIQDTWKVRRSLTLDLGLRWEMRGAPDEANGLIARPNQPLAYGAPPNAERRLGTGGFYRSDWNNLGPSIGLAWDPRGDGKTAIRTNRRIVYDRLPTFGLSTILQTLPGITLGVTNDEFGQSGGRLRNLPQISPPDVLPSSLAQPPAYSNNTFTVVDPNLKWPQHTYGPSEFKGRSARALYFRSTKSDVARTTCMARTMRTSRRYSGMTSLRHSTPRKPGARALCWIL